MEPGTRLDDEHHKLVHGLASKLRRELSLAGEIGDLISFGYGGLLEAEQRFDAARGVRFKTYAYHRVRGAMLDGIRKMTHLPRRAHEQAEDAADAQATASPAPMPLHMVFARLSASLVMVGPLHGQSAERSPEEQFIHQESVARLLRALRGLPERQRWIVRGHYFEGRSLDALARELGVSRSWASRLHTGALAQLREAMSP
ncbi:MAG: sigma-70 family RNA polymerase sigma factor [Myxococcota bacterium]